jgi:4-amino-4-deoxy-L-arabinose transferase-like glycosyltransferase
MPLLDIQSTLKTPSEEVRTATSEYGWQAQPLPRGIPEHSSLDRRVVVWLFLASFLYHLLFLRYTAVEPDEGIILQGAQRVLSGEIPYRDFFTFLTPGSFYLLALLFKVFGSSFVVARTGLVFFGPVFSVINYLLARRVCSRGSALTVAVLVTLNTLPYRFLVLHNWDSTLWTCLAVYCAVRFLENPGWKWGFGMGSFAALTFVFEQSKGTGLCLGLALGLLAIACTGRPKEFLQKAHLAGIALGLAWPMSVTLTYFAAQRSLTIMLADWFWPLHHYSLANRVPYGYQNWSNQSRHLLFGVGFWWVRLIKILAISPGLLVPVLPLVAAGLFVYWLVQMRRNSSYQAKSAYYVLITAILLGLLLSVVMVRADVIHFMYLLPLFALVLSWICDGRDIPGKMFEACQPYLRRYIVVAFGFMAIALVVRSVKANEKIVTRRGTVAMPSKDTVVPYVQQRVPAGAAMLVYPYLPLYNYLTGTTSPTRYDYFQPGMNTREQADDMVRQLDSNRVPFVLFESSFGDKISNSWPRTPLAAITQDPVADYIARQYRDCKVLESPSGWRFLFMVRKDLACP